jgi:hypothetical protein
MRYEYRPLANWTDPVTEYRPPCRFKAAWSDTLRLLGRETELLGADLVVFQVDVRAGNIRNDGMLYQRAQVEFPGVRIAFNSTHGPLTYATDRFDDWRDNVRGIALGLEALRKVDRYGMTRRGEQYRGWLAIEAGNGKITSQEARALIEGYGGLTAALYATHPDHGGDADAFHAVQEARRVLGL